MRSWLLPLGCLSVLSAGALAQQAPSAPAGAPAPEVRQACQADLQKFCANVQPGGGRIKECIAQHKDELSQGCRDALAAAHQQHAPPAGQGKPQ